MSKKFKFVLNPEGVRQLLTSNEMMGVCQDYANAMKASAGDGYDTSSYHGKNRVNVSVYPKTDKAYKDNQNNNTLLKAVRSK